MKKVSLLWTGGWDSTFRLVELSFQDMDIFPIYVLDKERKSYEIELERMQKILELLRAKPKTRANINDIEVISKEDIPIDDEITNAYNLIREKTNLGSQHEWLARLGKIRPGLEIGTEAGSPSTSHILHAINEFGVLILDGNTGYLDPKHSSKEGMLVLGWFSFPIITRTELDMKKQIFEWKYEDVMELIWFCHSPKNKKPCGLCHPCEVKIESGMQFLLPRRAVIRYRCKNSMVGVWGKNFVHRLGQFLRKII